MTGPKPGKPSYRSTFPSALIVAVTFLAAGFALDWLTADFTTAMEEFWPSRVIAFAVLLPVMMLIL